MYIHCFKVCSCIPFSPSVVMDDANIEVAARRIMWAKCANAGQTCIAPDYVLCHSKVKERFIKGVKKSLNTFFRGEPEKSTDYGRIVNSNHFQSVLCYNTYVCIYSQTSLICTSDNRFPHHPHHFLVKRICTIHFYLH